MGKIIKYITPEDKLAHLLDRIALSTTSSYNGIPCWEWKLAKDIDGYGQCKLFGKSNKAHRLAYAIYKELPEHLVIDHLCRNRACCNPDHLEAVTNVENIERGETGSKERSKTHCPKGHEYNLENTFWEKKPKEGKYGRKCIKCKNFNQNRRYSERKAI